MTVTYSTIPDTSGIYSISFEELPNTYYIGCSTSIKNRIKDHLSALLRNNHTNCKLQEAFNIYKNPIISIVELCSIDDIFNKEIFYITKYNSFIKGFNLTPGGEGSLCGETNGNAKYSIDEYYKVLNLLANTDLSHQAIVKETGISIHVIKKISSLTSHRYLELLYPDEYSLLKAKAKTRDNSAVSKGISYPPILSPEGISYIVTNIHQFAKEHGLQYQNLHKVLIGSRKTHKGWKLQ